MKPTSLRLFTLLLLPFLLLQAPVSPALADADPNGLSYTNFIRPGPIEIHVLRMPRHTPSLEIQSIHSGGKPIGRTPVSEQLKQIQSGPVIAAINGDFFQLEGPFAGDPRGLQIVNRALISAPTGAGSFWLDSANAPHIAITMSRLRITWPNNSTTPIGLNAKCDTNQLILYTTDMDTSRISAESVAREIVLLPRGNQTNSALHAGTVYSLTVHEIREPSSLPTPPGAFLLAIGRTALASLPALEPGAIIKISTATLPNLASAVNAIGGGPILVISGKQQRFDKAASNAFKDRFTVEKHPRTALGWSEKEFIWVEIDGRRKDSIGMTLNELGAFMIELGCVEAMNLDGGGSSTIWFDGKVRNRPSDGAERPVANSLALVRKPVPAK